VLFFTIGGSFDLTDSTLDNSKDGSVMNTASADITGTHGIITDEGHWEVTQDSQEHVFAQYVNDGGHFQCDGQCFATAGITCSSGGTVDVESNSKLFTPTCTITLGTFEGVCQQNAGLEGNLTCDYCTVRPGHSPGILTVNGDFAGTSNSILSIQLGGLSAGSNYDQFVVTGTATLKGMLNVELINGFQPVAGNQFTVMTHGAHTGTFPVKNGLSLNNGLYLLPMYAANSLTLVATNMAADTPTLTTSAGPTGNGFPLSWPGVAGQSYQVETSPDLVHWYVLTNLLGEGAQLNFLDTNAGTHAVGFYRIH
jgi:hypothetical protein